MERLLAAQSWFFHNWFFHTYSTNSHSIFKCGCSLSSIPTAGSDATLVNSLPGDRLRWGTNYNQHDFPFTSPYRPLWASPQIHAVSILVLHWWNSHHSSSASSHHSIQVTNHITPLTHNMCRIDNNHVFLNVFIWPSIIPSHKGKLVISKPILASVAINYLTFRIR